MTLSNGRKRVGLALGGGVARGAAHIGVLSILEEAGVPIDCLVGTSAGSIIGAAYCAGLDLGQMRLMAAQMNWQQIARPALPKRGFFNFNRLDPWLESFIGELDIQDLPLPFAAATTDIYSGETVVLSQGRLTTAVRASSSVPGVVTPVEIDGRLLCDGGVSANIPIDAARDLGADYVIGVDLFAPEYDGRGGPLGIGFSALETLIRNSGRGVSEADCLIVPAINDHSYLRFSKSETYIALGEEAAREKLPQIFDDLSMDKR
jgi:NTE family protein